MQVDIDSERFFPTHIAYTEADGDTTAYDFTDLKWNTPFPAELFALQLPPGTETRLIDLGGDAKSQSRN